MPVNMTHNGFDFFKNLIKPLLKFMEAKHLYNPYDDEDDRLTLPDIFYIDQDFERLKRRERMKKQSKNIGQPDIGKLSSSKS